MHANITNEKRRAVYAREGYRCALCDNGRYLQVHHVIPRGEGGSDSLHNLICLCSTCHMHCHGVIPDGSDVTPEDMTQYCIEYLADYYAPTCNRPDGWNPWRKECEPWRIE